MTIVTTSVRILSVSLACFAAGALHAASVATLNNPVPNGFIQMDGSLSDWLAVPWYADDTVGDGSVPGPRIAIDILGGAIAHDENFIYFLYRNAEDGMVDGFSNWIFIDLDQNQTTGFSGAVNEIAGLPIGMEFNLGGTAGWNAWDSAGAFAGGGAGKSVAVGDSDGSGGADFLEFAISRTAAQPNGIPFNPIGGTELDVMFIAENPTGDYYPDDPANWFTYDAAGTYDPGVPGDANDDGNVTIDDYLLVRGNSFTSQFLGQNGDINDDGFVDFEDFHEWKAHFPGGAAAADAAIASLGVPEPATLGAGLVALMGGLLMLGRTAKR